MKRYLTEWENICKLLFQQMIVSWIYWELKKNSTTTKNKSSYKWIKDLNREISEEERQKINKFKGRKKKLTPNPPSRLVPLSHSWPALLEGNSIPQFLVVLIFELLVGSLWSIGHFWNMCLILLTNYSAFPVLQWLETLTGKHLFSLFTEMSMKWLLPFPTTSLHTSTKIIFVLMSKKQPNHTVGWVVGNDL